MWFVVFLAVAAGAAANSTTGCLLSLGTESGYYPSCGIESKFGHLVNVDEGWGMRSDRIMGIPSPRITTASMNICFMARKKSNHLEGIA
jgi:hypothetical protein